MKDDVSLQFSNWLSRPKMWFRDSDIKARTHFRFFVFSVLVQRASRSETSHILEWLLMFLAQQPRHNVLELWSILGKQRQVRALWFISLCISILAVWLLMPFSASYWHFFLGLPTHSNVLFSNPALFIVCSFSMKTVFNVWSVTQLSFSGQIQMQQVS